MQHRFISEGDKSTAEISLLAMAGDAYKEHVAGLLKVIRASKIVKEDSIPCLIEDGLFLGSLGAANNKTALKALNVTHILTVAHSLIPSHPNDFVYKIIQGSGENFDVTNIRSMLLFQGIFRDTEDAKLSQYFDECFAFIDEAKVSGGGVLVHCFLGRSRRVACFRLSGKHLSVTVVVAYLMFKHGMSLSEAVDHVRVKRPMMCPNQGFISQLEEYAKYLQDAKNKDRAAHEPEKSGSSV
ncbi:hypothetical protein SASPL_103793 [Salvia splendens]|uniref:protein-tyrosine-phosphatase n=1 Tax=Salvia splendens TaxID=180675 RepID=A0A8X8YIQ7_SALSN|nr:hypothetical protein SASPL_103793 [Salvia splendens]